MRLTTVTLADFASIREGLLNVTSGGINQVFAAALPVALPASLGLMVELAKEELTTNQIRLSVQIIVRPKGRRPVGQIDGLIIGQVLQTGLPVFNMPIVFDLRQIPLTHWGLYTIEISVGKLSTKVLFDVVLRAQAVPPAVEPKDEAG